MQQRTDYLHATRRVPYEPLMSLVEVLSVLCCFWWAFSMRQYPLQFLENRGFAALRQIAPQHTWGIVALCVGLLQLTALTLPAPEVLQRWSALLAIFWWGLIAGSIAYATHFSTGVGVYVCIALMQAGRLRRS